MSDSHLKESSKTDPFVHKAALAFAKELHVTDGHVKIKSHGLSISSSDQLSFIMHRIESEQTNSPAQWLHEIRLLNASDSKAPTRLDDEQLKSLDPNRHLEVLGITADQKLIVAERDDKANSINVSTLDFWQHGQPPKLSNTQTFDHNHMKDGIDALANQLVGNKSEKHDEAVKALDVYYGLKAKQP